MDDSKSHEQECLTGVGSGIRFIDDDDLKRISVDSDSETTRLFTPQELPSSAKSNADDPRIGVIIDDRYRVVRRLAVGSTGVVYLAHRIGLERLVAIKFLELFAAKHKTFLALFEREARAMAQLSHPNCLSVTDYGVADVPYMVMDLVDGYTLKELTDRGPLGPYRTIPIVVQLLAALAHAHRKGIVHRDIKPGNIMLSEVTGTSDFVRVFDFGMAKLIDVEHSDVDDPDVVLGTPHYMSPEHIRNQGLDERSDLFSAGIVLYESLTGHKPFLVNDPTDILHMHDDLPPSINRGLDPGSFSTELEAVVKRSLDTDISKRFQTAIEFRNALLSVPEARASMLTTIYQHSKSDADIASIDRSNRRLGKIKGKGRTVLLASIAVLSGLLALNIYFWMSIRSKTDEAVRVTRVDAPSVATRADSTGKQRAGGIIQATMPKALSETSSTRAVASDISTPATATFENDSEVASDREDSLDRSRPMKIRQILAQVETGGRDKAIADLTDLKDGRPDNAYLYFLLGNLYSQERQWSQAIEMYQIAVKKDPGYKTHKLLVGNSVLALIDDVVYPAAEAFIEKEVGTVAIPKLLPLAQRKAVPRLQERAQKLIDRLSSVQQ